KRICNPLHNRFASAPCHEKGKPELPFCSIGAGDESRTRDLNLGKVALYQLSYSRVRPQLYTEKSAAFPAQCVTPACVTGGVAAAAAAAISSSVSGSGLLSSA